MKQEKKGTGFSLKDHLFNAERVTYLGKLFEDADASFDRRRFEKEVMKRLGQLELKERIVHISHCLERFLPPDFRKAAEKILNALPPPLDPSLKDNDFGDFIFAPLGDFVVRNGMEKKDLKRSLQLLRELTQRFSMEDSLRSFINTHTEETLRELTQWSTDQHYHVRRLVSEATRPRLPWSGRLVIDMARPIPLLDQLHADPTRYVTRSVANHLNDIAKSDPRLVLNTLQRWREWARQDEQELQWIFQHALRTLVKQGNSEALQFLGYGTKPQVQVKGLALSASRILPGESIEFSFSISARRDEALVIDYVIDFMKANGSHAPKVHKLKKLRLKAGETQHISKRHKLMANATTYTLYPGRHFVTIQINGSSFGKLSFDLLPA